jgi:hypothetical protein
MGKIQTHGTEGKFSYCTKYFVPSSEIGPRRPRPARPPGPEVTVFGSSGKVTASCQTTKQNFKTFNPFSLMNGWTSGCDRGFVWVLNQITLFLGPWTSVGNLEDSLSSLQVTDWPVAYDCGLVTNDHARGLRPRHQSLFAFGSGSRYRTEACDIGPLKRDAIAKAPVLFPLPRVRIRFFRTLNQSLVNECVRIKHCVQLSLSTTSVVKLTST